jgi:cell division protein FtsI/penicillin-binding protein 2
MRQESIVPVPVNPPRLRDSKLYKVVSSKTFKDQSGDSAFGVPSVYTVSEVIRKSDGQRLIRQDRWRATKFTAKTGNLGFCHGGLSYTPAEVREFMFILVNAGYSVLPNE